MASPLPTGYNLTHHATLKSTNEEAKRLAAKYEPHGTVILADSQTAGKGRDGRTWVSTQGNLHLSLLLRPNLPLRQLTQLPLVAAIAVGNTLAHYLPSLAYNYKWPNDIRVEEAKIGGILVESGSISRKDIPKWVVVGFGVNLAETPRDIDISATSLYEHGEPGTRPAVADFAAELVRQWDMAYATWREEGFKPIREAWLARAYGLGKHATLRGKNWQQEGTLETLDEEGRLLLRKADGAVAVVDAGDVFF